MKMSIYHFWFRSWGLIVIRRPFILIIPFRSRLRGWSHFVIILIIILRLCWWIYWRLWGCSYRYLCRHRFLIFTWVLLIFFVRCWQQLGLWLIWFYLFFRLFSWWVWFIPFLAISTYGSGWSFVLISSIFVCTYGWWKVTNKWDVSRFILMLFGMIYSIWLFTIIDWVDGFFRLFSCRDSRLLFIIGLWRIGN